jgi:pimeloyl-ACP methyl ester carboxylesterase
VDLQRAFDSHLSNDAVVEFLGGRPRDVPDHYHEADPAQLPIAQARQILILGSADDVVPPAFSRDYLEKKKKSKEDVALVEIAKADHFDVIDPRSAAWPRVEVSVLELLG